MRRTLPTAPHSGLQRAAQQLARAAPRFDCGRVACGLRVTRPAQAAWAPRRRRTRRSQARSAVRSRGPPRRTARGSRGRKPVPRRWHVFAHDVRAAGKAHTAPLARARTHARDALRRGVEIRAACLTLVRGHAELAERVACASTRSQSRSTSLTAADPKLLSNPDAHATLAAALVWLGVQPKIGGAVYHAGTAASG